MNIFFESVYFWPYTIGVSLILVGFLVMLFNDEDSEDLEIITKDTCAGPMLFFGALLELVGMALLFITFIIHVVG